MTPLQSQTIIAGTIRAKFHYDPETGIFTRKTSNRTQKAGDIVGVAHTRGYLTTHINGSHKFLHRMAWMYVYGSIPDGMQIDHINRVKTDNRLCNLRLASNSENHQNNVKPMPFNSTGFLGVAKKRGRFRAAIKVDKKWIQLGVFDTPEEASLAYWEAKKDVHSHCPETQG